MRELSDAKSKQYLNGSKRAYVIVAGTHQFFPRRELNTLDTVLKKPILKDCIQKSVPILVNQVGKTSHQDQESS